MNMANYFCLLFQMLARDKKLWAATVLLAVLVALPMVVPIEAFFEGGIGREYQEGRLAELQTALADGSYDTAPQRLRDYVAQELEYTKAMVEATDDATFFQALGKLCTLQVRENKEGFLQGVSPATFEAQAVFYSAVAELDDPIAYSRTTRMASLPYLSFISSQYPSILWMAPGLLAALAALVATRAGTMLGRAPLSEHKRCLAVWLASCSISVPLFVTALLPTLIWTMTRNGLGDPAYPVVYINAGEVFQKTVGIALFQEAALMLLGIGVLTALAILVSRVFFNASKIGAYVGALIAAGMAFVPMVTGFFSADNAAIMNLLPVSYLSPSDVAGALSYDFIENQLLYPGISESTGLIVLAAFVSALLAVLLSITAVASMRRMAHGAREAVNAEPC